jgi:hypothetical protein
MTELMHDVNSMHWHRMRMRNDGGTVAASLDKPADGCVWPRSGRLRPAPLGLLSSLRSVGGQPGKMGLRTGAGPGNPAGCGSDVTR